MDNAGKAFAMIAAEVKSLAQQTAKATEEINQKITAVNASCGAVIAIMEQVISAIARLGEGTIEMATAVSQQAVAIQEISPRTRSRPQTLRAFVANKLDKNTRENDDTSRQALGTSARSFGNFAGLVDNSMSAQADRVLLF